MTYYSDETYEIERNGRVFTMRLVPEYDYHPAMTDWIGVYTSKDDDYIVDRKDGVLYGLWGIEPEHPELIDKNRFF